MSDDVIGRRSTFLWQRVEAAYHAYYHVHHETPRQHFAASNVLDNALLAYRLCVARYNRDVTPEEWRGTCGLVSRKFVKKCINRT